METTRLRCTKLHRRATNATSSITTCCLDRRVRLSPEEIPLCRFGIVDKRTGCVARCEFCSLDVLSYVLPIARVDRHLPFAQTAPINGAPVIGSHLVDRTASAVIMGNQDG